MLTLKVLLDLTRPEIKQRAAKQVTIRLLESFIDKDDNGIFKQVVIRAVATTIPRTVMFKLYQVTNKKFTINSPVWVSCTGEDWLYRWEVANTMRGSSSVINSNGALPRIKNPRIRPGLCKHAYAAAGLALKAIPKIMDIEDEETPRKSFVQRKVRKPKKIKKYKTRKHKTKKHKTKK